MPPDLRISGAQSAFSESDVRINFFDPCKIIAAANQIPLSEDTTRQGQFFSWDGGQTWQQTSLPANPNDDLQADPGVDWTSDGTAWATTIGYNFEETHLRLRSFKSTDGGATWSYEGDVSGDQTQADRAVIWVDHSSTSPFRDNIYVVWHNNDPVFVNRRAGAAGSWQTPLQVSGAETAGNGVGGDIKTNSAGDVFAFWPDAGSQKLFVAKSTDGGAKFGTPVTIAKTFVAAFSPDAVIRIFIPADIGPALYISGGAFRSATKNLVYAMWMDLSGEEGCNSGVGPGDDVSSTCKSRIWFSRSTNGGVTWEPARMINNEPSLNDQFFPRLAVDETNGLLVAIYYDTISDPGRHKTDVWMQCSSDDGLTWSHAKKVTSGQTDETVQGADEAQYGDYIGLTAYCGTFFATWTDRRSGGHEEIWGAPMGPNNVFRLVEFIASTV